MDSASETEAHELLAELRRLAERFPIPDSSWHAYVSELRQVAADLAAAVTALERLPDAAKELRRRIEGDERPVAPGGPELASAAVRLQALPLPAGEHPFLDEIAVTVEASRRMIAALASAEGGEDAFAAARAEE